MSDTTLLDELRELNERLRQNWSVDWNSPCHVLASDGSGKHQASAMTAAIAEDIAAMRNTLPAMIALIEAAQAFLDSEHELVSRIGSPLASFEAALDSFVGEPT